MVSTAVPSGAAMASAKKAAAAKAAAAAAKRKRSKSRLQPAASAASSSSSNAKVGELVESAIVALKESGGSSLAAIKQYLAASRGVDVEKLTPAIKKYLKSSASAKGNRAGAFKLSPVKKPRTPAKKKKMMTTPKKSPAKKTKKLAAKPTKPRSKKPAKKSAAAVVVAKPRKAPAKRK